MPRSVTGPTPAHKGRLRWPLPYVDVRAVLGHHPGGRPALGDHRVVALAAQDVRPGLRVDDHHPVITAAAGRLVGVVARDDVVAGSAVQAVVVVVEAADHEVVA